MVQVAHQVAVGEPCELLLDGVVHLGLGGQSGHVVEQLLLLLQVVLQQLDLGMQSLQLVPVLPGLGLQLGLQQSAGHAAQLHVGWTKAERTDSGSG